MISDIQGQEIPKKLLSSIIKKGKIPSALLFYGPPGVGKFSSALDFSGKIIGNPRKIKRGTHPDVMMVFPEFDKYEANEVLKIRKKGEYYKLRYSKASISIDTIRAMQHYAYLNPMEGKWRIFLIIQAENMTANASDAFLKLLEEPPMNVLFILIATHTHLLTKTILSRTLTIRFQPLSHSLQMEILKDKAIKYFGRGIEETLLLNSKMEIEDELDEIFFKTRAKHRIKDWKKDIEERRNIELLLLYLWKMVEDKYKNTKITADAAYRIFFYLKRAYEYYYSNITSEKILFYLFLKI